MTRSVAVLGLGTMGLPAAEALARAGSTVHGYDPSPLARERASAGGLQVHATPEEALALADLVLLSLPTPGDVAATAAGPLSKAGAGSLVADLSTIDPQTAMTVAATLAKSGVTYLDAPVLGRPEACGRWTLVVGGPADAVARLRSVLAGTIATSVVHVGDVGAASVIKLLNNLMFGAINAITAEALNSCRLAGVDPRIFVSTVADSGAATVSNLFRDLASRILDEQYDPPTFSVKLLHKDNRLALELAQRTGAPVFLAECIDRVNTLALDSGLTYLDTASLYGLYKYLSPRPDPQ